MLDKKEERKTQVHFLSLEDLLPEDHLVRKLEKAIDLDFIYEEVKKLYSDKGRTSKRNSQRPRTTRKKELKPLEEKEEHKETKVSTTDPESGVFHKGEHKKVFAYVTNVACDKNNYILDFELNAGNKHDSTEFPKLYRKLKKNYKNIKNVVVDAGYKTPAIAKELHTLRFTRFKGIEKNRNFLYLLFSCMNLKKFANKLYRDSLFLIIIQQLSICKIHILTLKEVYTKIISHKPLLSSVCAPLRRCFFILVNRFVRKVYFVELS